MKGAAAVAAAGKGSGSLVCAALDPSARTSLNFVGGRLCRKAVAFALYASGGIGGQGGYVA